MTHPRTRFHHCILFTKASWLHCTGSPGKVNKNDHEYVDQLLLLLSQAKTLVSMAFMDDVDMSRALWVRVFFIVWFFYPINDTKFLCFFCFFSAWDGKGSEQG